MLYIRTLLYIHLYYIIVTYRPLDMTPFFLLFSTLLAVAVVALKVVAAVVGKGVKGHLTPRLIYTHVY